MEFCVPLSFGREPADQHDCSLCMYTCGGTGEVTEEFDILYLKHSVSGNKYTISIGMDLTRFKKSRINTSVIHACFKSCHLFL